MLLANIARWLALALTLALVLILIRRRLYSRFPVFFGYCVAILGVTVVRFLVRGYPTTFFFVYWVSEAFYVSVAFLAMLSVLRPLTRFEYISHPWSRFVLVPTVLLIIAASLWFAIFRPIGRPTAARFASAMYVLVILMCLSELILFLESFRVRGRYPIKWTRYEFGILQGFGIMSLFNLIAYSALVFRLFHLYVGPLLEATFQWFPAGMFIGTAFAWILVFSKPEPPRPDPPPDALGKLQDAARLLEEQLEIVRELARRLRLRVLAPVTR
jgi:hypothetical protein